MKVGVKRVDEHEDRYAHVVDPVTARGLLLHYYTNWDWVRIQDMPNITTPKQMVDHLAKGRYIPMDVPDEEFNVLYDKSKSCGLPLFREGGDFDPAETPTLREMIEEDRLNHLHRVASILVPPYGL